MALMQLAVIPLGTATTSLAPFIAAIKKELLNLGLPFQLTDMGTTIEGDVSTLLNVAAQLHELPFHDGAQRVVTHIQIDDRRDKKVHLGDKSKTVDNLLG